MIVSLNVDMTAGGNYGYSPDCEQYTSIKKAEEAFWRIVDNEHVSDGNAFIGYIFLGEVKDCTDIQPDFMLTIGPRGGVKRSRC